MVKFYFTWRLNDSTSAEVSKQGLVQLGATLPFDALTYFTGLLGGFVLLTALLAWRGRPPQSRFVFQALVLLTCLSLIGETLYRLRESTAALDTSLDGPVYAALRCQIPFQILLSLYIIWYCNRAPARAFYRQEPLASFKKDETPPP
jgi:hypothetical protein